MSTAHTLDCRALFHVQVSYPYVSVGRTLFLNLTLPPWIHSFLSVYSHLYLYFLFFHVLYSFIYTLTCSVIRQLLPFCEAFRNTSDSTALPLISKPIKLQDDFNLLDQINTQILIYHYYLLGLRIQ